jgi:hypothetical protein
VTIRPPESTTITGAGHHNNARAAAATARAYRVSQWVTDGSATNATTVNTMNVATAATSINFGRPPSRIEYAHTPRAITTEATDAIFSVPCQR